MKTRLLALTCALCWATNVYAYTTPLHKLTAGIKDVIKGPFSIITVPVEHMENEHDKTLSVIGGLMEGAVQSVVKPLTGVFKIATFPFVNGKFEDE
jgi:hypothetical protein